MSTSKDMAECAIRDEMGNPLIWTGERCPVHAEIDQSYSPKIRADRGARVWAWFEQPQRYLVPLVVLLILVLTANGLVMGLNLSRQTQIENALRDDQVSQDLRKYETQQLRVQSSLNAELQKLILQQGCKR
jgi:hypothetical protein